MSWKLLARMSPLMLPIILWWHEWLLASDVAMEPCCCKTTADNHKCSSMPQDCADGGRCQQQPAFDWFWQVRSDIASNIFGIVGLGTSGNMRDCCVFLTLQRLLYTDFLAAQLIYFFRLWRCRTWFRTWSWPRISKESHLPLPMINDNLEQIGGLSCQCNWNFSSVSVVSCTSSTKRFISVRSYC